MNENLNSTDAEDLQNIIQGDCLDVMRTYPDNHFSGIVTDPPYGLKFMGKSWDHGLPPQEVWIEAFRVCKPGSIMLCFGGTRTFHRLACSIEDAGFEIRDCMMWLYGSGFPKSHNFGKQMGGEWSGYGTALKPAWEPIIVAMKPLEGTFAQNAEKWGVAGINIDVSRIETQDNLNGGSYGHSNRTLDKFGFGKVPGGAGEFTQPQGRWPANLLLDEESAQQLDQMTGVSKSPASGIRKAGSELGQSSGWNDHKNKDTFRLGHNDSGGASRFFYVAKASSAERSDGLEALMTNNHPTVKPLKLMQYLLRLIAPPSGGVILDPFAGSGSTVVAAKRLGIECVGIEKSAEYCEIARARIA